MMSHLARHTKSGHSIATSDSSILNLQRFVILRGVFVAEQMGEAVKAGSLPMVGEFICYFIFQRVWIHRECSYRHSNRPWNRCHPFLPVLNSPCRTSYRFCCLFLRELKPHPKSHQVISVHFTSLHVLVLRSDITGGRHYLRMWHDVA